MTAYRLYGSEVSGDFTKGQAPVGSVDGNTTEVTIVVPEELEYFVVTAVNEHDESDWSNEVSRTNGPFAEPKYTEEEQ